MSEYIIRVDENDERWHYVEQQYTHFFGYPITEEIVRCRDCKYARKTDAGMDCDRHILCARFNLDSFCSWGERRSG